MKKIKHILIPVLVVASGIVAFAATPGLRRMVLPQPSQPAAVAIVNPVYDAAADSLFTELAGLYNKAGQLRAFMIEGNIRLVDQADTSLSLNTRFRYCRQDSMSYYQLGEQEMLTLPDLYLSVDHSVRKIMLSPNVRPANTVIPLIDQEALKKIKEEGYAITREMKDPYTVIRLRNPNHVTCRELRIAYDTARMIRSFFMRNSDMSDPGNPSLDKLITVNILHWETAAVPGHLLRPSRFIQRSGNGWAPAAPFKDYEIKYIY